MIQISVARDVIIEYPGMTNMYVPKRSCPRDLGFWHCEECVKNHLEEQSWLDFPVPIRGCGKPFDDKVCGKTHLGYRWCKECQADGRTEPRLHIGEFEVVGRIQSD